MLKLTNENGTCEFFAPQHIVTVEPDGSGNNGATVCTVIDSRNVRESPAEVARLVAEALRPAAGVDLEAVAMARQVLDRLADVFTAASVNVQDVGDAIDDVLATEVPQWCRTAARLRAIAARLGGAS